MAEEPMDLSGAVDMLKTMLSGEDGQRQLENILEMFGGESPEERVPGESAGGIDPENLEMMMKIQRAMAAMNRRQNNEQAQLLLALRPFLKPVRQEKVDHAMQLLKFTGMIEIMREVQED